jgi:hypothetical protein
MGEGGATTANGKDTVTVVLLETRLELLEWIAAAVF